MEGVPKKIGTSGFSCDGQERGRGKDAGDYGKVKKCGDVRCLKHRCVRLCEASLVFCANMIWM